MSDSLHIVCPHCDAVNRIPEARLGSGPKCGKCHDPVFQASSVALDEARFQQHVSRSDIPILVDFWADWCGPCHMMAPAFEEAARRLEPRVRLVKVNTEQARNLSMRMGIRSIPTLVLFKGGGEVDRVSGAMDPRGLVNWVNQHI